MPKKAKAEQLFIYKFVISRPVPEVVDIMPELGLQVRKVIEGIWYLSASFVTHNQAKFLCEKTGVVATGFKRIPMDERALTKEHKGDSNAESN